MSAPATTSTTDTIQPAKCVFIFGITGIQGSSVARELREAGVHVVGLTRNSESENAKSRPGGVASLTIVEVAATGAKLVTGDMDRPETYEAALKDVDGVFLNLDCELNTSNEFVAVGHSSQSGSFTLVTDPPRRKRR